MLYKLDDHEYIVLDDVSHVTIKQFDKSNNTGIIVFTTNYGKEYYNKSYQYSSTTIGVTEIFDDIIRKLNTINMDTKKIYEYVPNR